MYKTTDICIAATLESVGIPVISVSHSKKKDGKIVLKFYFEDSPDLEIALKKYWEHMIKVDPREFFNNLKGLKTRIWEARNDI